MRRNMLKICIYFENSLFSNNILEICAKVNVIIFALTYYVTLCYSIFFLQRSLRSCVCLNIKLDDVGLLQNYGRYLHRKNFLNIYSSMIHKQN